MMSELTRMKRRIIL